jgi:phage terminase large subunit-like protein
MKAKLNAWKSDPVAFIHEVLINPETGKAFVLYDAEIEFLRRAFTLTPEGRLPFPEMIFSAPKKSGKTGLAAMCALYAAIAIGGSFAEVYCLANDYEQASSRVYQAAARIVEASPLLRHSAKVTADKIVFRSTGSFVQACASDYTGFAGSNPTLTICDELWGFIHEASRRLFDEAVPSPTRKVSGRLVVTYAGFEGESDLLESLHKRGLAVPEIAPDLRAGGGILMYWTNRAAAPWHTQEWLDQMRQSLRPNQYLRMIENRWVTTESSFIEMDWWDECVDQNARPVLSDHTLPIWIGVDASVKRDSTAIVAVTFDRDAKKARLVWHRIFQPSAKDPLDFEATVEATLLELRGRFNVKEVKFDPYQMQSVAQRLTNAGLPMVEFPQSVPNLTEASTNLFEIIKSRNLIVYPDDDIRLAINRAVAIEASRGWRIAKEKVSHKIDVVVALGMATLSAVKEGQKGTDPWIAFIERDLAREKATKNRCAKCAKPLVEGEPFAQSRGLKFCSNQCSW